METAAITFVLVLAFCAVHLFVGKLHFLDREPRSKWLSFAAYVFMHLIPEIGAHELTFKEATGLPAPLAGSLVYALALAGLALFYGIERRLATSRHLNIEEQRPDRPEAGAFWLHISATSLLMLVIGYLIIHREDNSLAGLGLYFIAMLLHLVTGDYGARRNHPERYDAAGRWVLVAASLAGWAIGLAFALPEVAIGGLFAFLGGAIILVVMKEELPEERQSYFLPFLFGVCLYAALAVAEEALMLT